MSVQVKRRRGTTAQHATFTGAVGEITVDTDKDTAVVHDGATAGGFPLAKKSDLLGPLDNVSRLGINATSDATNKLSVKSSAVLFDNIGNGMQGKINKNALADTASLLYQTGFSGRAEIGTTGDDNFHFKVSANGSTWFDALDIAASSGLITLPIGQIKFPAVQNASSDANTLDDYEEGTFTPTLLFGGAAIGMTYSAQTARYTKIGRFMFGELRITLTAKGTSTGAATITGNPFANLAGIPGGVSSYFYANMVALTSPPLGYMLSAGSTFNLQHGGAAGTANLTDANFTNTSDILLKFSFNT